MKTARWLALLVLPVLLAGCAGSNDKDKAQGNPSKKAEPAPAPQDAEAKIKASLAKLSDDDRSTAELQKFCAVHDDSRLGSMGVPVKITLKKADEDVDVFLCCKACEKDARKDPAKTLAAVEELIIQSNVGKLGAEDRSLAEAQKFCAVEKESRLGAMGKPIKYVVKDKDGEHAIFVCCGNCIKEVKKDEAKALKAAEELKQKKKEAPKVDEAKIKANLSKLDDDDREAAETQKFCAVHGDSRLGSMGVPVKIKVKKGKEEVEAFLCCKECAPEARKDEAKTAAAVEALVITGNLAKLSADDRKLAEAQKFCVVEQDSPLGSMGAPKKYIIKDKDGEHPVFVCCGGCIKEIKKDEAKALKAFEELKKKNAKSEK
jgi:hypothetical protein